MFILVTFSSFFVNILYRTPNVSWTNIANFGSQLGFGLAVDCYIPLVSNINCVPGYPDGRLWRPSSRTGWDMDQFFILLTVSALNRFCTLILVITCLGCDQLHYPVLILILTFEYHSSFQYNTCILRWAHVVSTNYYMFTNVVRFLSILLRITLYPQYII